MKVTAFGRLGTTALEVRKFTASLHLHLCLTNFTDAKLFQGASKFSNLVSPVFLECQHSTDCELLRAKVSVLWRCFGYGRAWLCRSSWQASESGPLYTLRHTECAPFALPLYPLRHTECAPFALPLYPLRHTECTPFALPLYFQPTVSFSATLALNGLPSFRVSFYVFQRDNSPGPQPRLP